MDDREAMGAASDEARAAMDHGDVPIGAVVVVDGKIVARRQDQRQRTRPPPTPRCWRCATWPATVGSWRLGEASLVVTLEPCPMCAGAVNARVGRVAFGARDLKAGAMVSLYGIGSDPRLNHEVEVTADLRAEECAELLTTFFADRR